MVPVNLPPLRQRIDDIPELVNHFIERFGNNKNILVTPDAIRVLKKYNWPGNIRELRNVIHRTVLFCNSKIDVEDLPVEIATNTYPDNIISSCLECFITNKISFNDVANSRPQSY